MKWAGKRSELSPSRPSLITRVLSPVSWFSKFKQKGGSPETVPSRKEQRNKLDFPTSSSSSMAGGLKQGRFYSDDDDDYYWRLSFGEERVAARRSTGGIDSHVWCDPGGDEFLAPGSGFRSEYRNFNEMVMDVKKMREKKDKQKISSLQGYGVYRSRNVDDHGSVKSSYGVVRGSQREARRGYNGRGEGYSRSRPKDIFAVEPEDVVKIARDYRKSPAYQPEKRSPNLGPISGFDRVSISEWQCLEEKRVKEITVKPESQNKVTTRKVKQNTRVKAYSPRTECKIRALEEKKKARIKLKRVKEERKEDPEVVEGRAVFDSFAVVKSSFNPQQDFKDSMVEMIREKGIRRPEELEELLACYLTLNCDEYHDLIIKVLRQVWLEMNFV